MNGKPKRKNRITCPNCQHQDVFANRDEGMFYCMNCLAEWDVFGSLNTNKTLRAGCYALHRSVKNLIGVVLDALRL